jgi:hypothetical protein
LRNPPYLEAKDTPAPPPQLPVAAATPVATPKLDEKLIEHAPLLAARLSRASDADAFAFLEGVRTEVFVAAWKGLSPGAQEVALRLAPAHLRSAALPELPAEQRQEIALAWVRKPEVSAAYALAAADELRERIANLHAGPAEADRALADLLDSLPRDEQDALLERLRREGDSRSASGLLTESALAYAPTDLLGAALLGVAPARLVAYMGGTDEAVRTHLLAACPARVGFALAASLAGCMMPDETAVDASVPPAYDGGGSGGPPPPPPPSPPPPPDLDGGLGWGTDAGTGTTAFPGSGLRGDQGTGVLVMMRIDRGTANLADAIELLVKQFSDQLDAAGLKTSSVAVADLYRGNLIWGTRLNTNPRRSLADALRLQAAQVDTTVRLSGCTTEGLRSIGSRVGNMFTEDGMESCRSTPSRARLRS